jgi:hypothetical protein
VHVCMCVHVCIHELLIPGWACEQGKYCVTRGKSFLALSFPEGARKGGQAWFLTALLLPGLKLWIPLVWYKTKVE